MDPRDPSTWPADIKAQVNIKLRADWAKRCAARGDVLGWNEAVNPRTYHLPFCPLHHYQVETRHEPESGIEAPRFHAKCQDPESVILGEFGTKKAKDVFAGDIVYSLDAKNKICRQVVVAVQGAQNKTGFIVKTRSGKRIKISSGHRMLTFGGYIPVESIHPGEYIGALNAVIDGTVEIPESELKFIAYMLFEGYCGTDNGKISRKTFTTSNEDTRADFLEALRGVGLWENKSYVKIENTITSTARHLLCRYGINNKGSKAKRMPPIFFRLSHRQKLIFFSIMLDTDGFVSQKARSWGITLANEGLIDDIQLLAATCGIIASKRHMVSSYRKKDGTRFYGDAWGLLINPVFAESLIAFNGCKTDKLDKLRKIYEGPSRGSLYDIFPNRIKKCISGIDDKARAAGVRVDCTRYEMTRKKLERLNAACPHPDFEKALRQDIFWDKVVSVEPTGLIEDYVDIQVSGEENYIANGLVSHNTAIGCAGIPLYQALEEPTLYDYILNVQGNEKKALAVNTGIKLELEQNPILHYLYGDQTGRDKWTDSLFVLRNGVAFQAATTGQSLRGTNYRLRRPNYVILDDAYDDSQIRNLETTRAVNDWVESTLEPMLAKDRPAVYRWQGTAVNDADGLKKMEERSKVSGSKVKFRRYCAFGGFDEKGTWSDTGAVLWPELRSHAAWQLKQSAPGTNQVIFNREHLNVRGSDAESVVKSEWLKVPDWRYDPNTAFRFGVDHILLAIIIACDPSVGKRQENDPTGFATIIKTQRMDGSLPYYYIDALRNERLSVQARIDHIKSELKIYRERFPMANAFEVRIETVAGFADFGDTVAAQVDAPVTCKTQAVDKLAHLESKSMLLQNRRVFLNKYIEGILQTELEYQITTNYPQHDDLRDAFLIGVDANDEGVWKS